jgi:hypothetical protein
MNIQINEAALAAVINDERGPVAAELKRHAEEFAVDSREAISVPRPKPWGSGRSDGLNPLMQTGLLRESIATEGPKIEDSGQHAGNIVVYVVSDGRAFRRGYDYAKILLNGGINGDTPYGPYKFLSQGALSKLTDE